MDYSIESMFSEDKHCWEVTISGEVDIFNSQDLKSTLVSLVSETKGNIEINCAGISYMDSTALGALVGALKSVKAAGHEIILQNVKPNLLKIFKITNLDKVFIIEGDKNE